MILIALGANLPSVAGRPSETLQAALSALQANGILPVKVSRFHETQAWPDPSDPPYVNAVAQIETALEPAALLARLHEIERQFGRQRHARNAPRTLDLDIVDYNGRVEEGPPVLPHPRMQDRAFVLAPLAEIAPGWRHPVLGMTAGKMLAGIAARA